MKSVIRVIFDVSYVDDRGRVWDFQVEHFFEDEVIKNAMPQALSAFREQMRAGELEGAFVHSIVAEMSDGREIIMMQPSHYSKERGRQCRMQSMWHWFRKSPSLTRLDVCSQELEDMGISVQEIEGFERVALGVVNG